MKPEKPSDINNHQRAPMHRESLFDRKLQQWRNTGEFTRPSKAVFVGRGTGETTKVTMERAKALVIESSSVSELEKAAFLDPLTEKLNVRTMFVNLKEEIRRARRYKQSLGLLIVEIDGFDALKSNNSPLALEYALKAVSETISKNIREVDMLGRLDNGTFMILCPETAMYQLSPVADRLRRALSTARINHLGHRLQLTVSAGIAAYPETGNNESDIFKSAVEALKIAVQSGGDAVGWAEPIAKKDETF